MSRQCGQICAARELGRALARCDLARGLSRRIRRWARGTGRRPAEGEIGSPFGPTTSQPSARALSGWTSRRWSTSGWYTRLLRALALQSSSRSLGVGVLVCTRPHACVRTCAQELDGSDVDGLLSNSPVDTAAALIEDVYSDAVAHIVKRMAVGEHATRQPAACDQKVRAYIIAVGMVWERAISIHAHANSRSSDSG